MHDLALHTYSLLLALSLSLSLSLSLVLQVLKLQPAISGSLTVSSLADGVALTAILADM